MHESMYFAVFIVIEIFVVAVMFFDLSDYSFQFLALVLLVIAGGFLFRWCQGIRQRNRLAREYRGSAVIHLRSDSGQEIDHAFSVKILKVDGEKAASFLYKWPSKHAVYVKPGVHSMEVRADWLMRVGWHRCGFAYTVEKLPEVAVEAGADYALEYEVRDDTWTLFRLKNNHEIDGRGVIAAQFAYPAHVEEQDSTAALRPLAVILGMALMAAMIFIWK